MPGVRATTQFNIDEIWTKYPSDPSALLLIKRDRAGSRRWEGCEEFAVSLVSVMTTPQRGKQCSPARGPRTYLGEGEVCSSSVSFGY